MIEIAKLPADDRRELFHNTAAKIGLHDAIVEKDFWVCLTLDYLFHRSPWKKAVTFKGGTSLSKGYHLISRFSEDIDLILDWRVLGYGISEPWEKRSNTKQEAFNKEANRKAKVFLAETFCPQVREGLSAELGLPANLYIDEEDKQTAIFAYPNLRCLHLAGDPAGDWGAGCLDTSRACGYCVVCRGTVPAVIQAERGFCSDSCAGTNFLGKSYDPSP